MSNEDAFQSFRRAFEEQRYEIQRIYDRVSKLEQANTEVLAYVRRTGNLPVLDNESLKRTISQSHARNFARVPEFSCTMHDSKKPGAESNASLLADPRGSDEEVSITNSTELNSDLSSNSAFLSVRTSEHCTPELSTIIGQQTKEIEKSLTNLNLDPAKRMQIVNQIQSNLSAILSSQLALADTDGVEQGVRTTDVNSSNPSTSKSNGSPKIPQLFYDDGSTLGGFQLPMDPCDSISELHPHSGQDITLMDQTDCPTPVNPPALPDMHEKRRQALHRANQRMHAPMHHQNLVHIDQHKGSTMAARSSMIPVPQNPVLPATPSRTKTTRGSLPGSGDENYANPISALRALNATEYAYLKKTREFSCPCGNEKTCPLHPVKQYRFASDSRVSRGFTLLAAVFRGRFVRQLLATHKVFDLIRTVKDSAKLALSIHAERSASDPKISDPKHLEFESPTTKADRLSNEELALESRLLTQLRGALAQLHEIFFTWSLASQIELLNISRSLPQRTKKPSAKSHIPFEDPHSVDVRSDPFMDSWASRGPVDYRHRRNASGNQWSSSQTESEEDGKNRPLRELQSDQVNRFCTQVMAKSPEDRAQEKLLDLSGQSGSTRLRRQQLGECKPVQARVRRPNNSISVERDSASPVSDPIRSNHERRSVHARPALHSAPARTAASRGLSSKLSVERSFSVRSAPTTGTRVPFSSSPAITAFTNRTSNSQRLQPVIRNPNCILSTVQSQSTTLHTTASPKSNAYSSLGKRVDSNRPEKSTPSVQDRPAESKTQMDNQEAFRVEQSSPKFIVPVTRKIAFLTTFGSKSDDAAQTDLPFQPNVDHQPAGFVERNSSALVQPGAEGNIIHRSNHAPRQYHNRNKRPISGQSGHRRVGTTVSDATGDWYPVRRRIIASQVPDSFADTTHSFLSHDLSTHMEIHASAANCQYPPPWNLAKSINKQEVSGDDSIVPTRRLNRWGDDEIKTNRH